MRGVNRLRLRASAGEKKDLSARTGFGTASHVDGHFQVYGDAEFAVGQRVDADHFGDDSPNSWDRAPKHMGK